MGEAGGVITITMENIANVTDRHSLMAFVQRHSALVEKSENRLKMRGSF